MELWKEEKDNAAYELSDEIRPIRDKLQKANLLVGDVLEDFFYEYDPEKEKDNLYMTIEFERFKILTDISSKLIWEALREIRELEARGDNVSKAKNQKLERAI